MKTKRFVLVMTILLFGLVFFSPTQSAAAASAAATFTYTVSPNPVDYYGEVTFTISAVGTDPTYQPYGSVLFMDQGQVINECGWVELNYDYSTSTYIPDSPAVCTVRMTEIGSHTITAYFGSENFSLYDSTDITLDGGLVVNMPEMMTLSPAAITDAATYGEPYSLQLSGICGEGGDCGTIWWRASTTYHLPPGMSLSDTGVIEGQPSRTGYFSFIVDAYATGYTGGSFYYLNILPATPVVTIDSTSFRNGAVTLEASVKHPNPNWAVAPEGTVTFTVNGVPLEGCSGVNAVPLDSTGQAKCETSAPDNWFPGEYPVQATFTPGPYDYDYNGASGTGLLSVEYFVNVLLFQDLDMDGIKDDGEGPMNLQRVVNLDEGCDGGYMLYELSENGLYAFATMPYPTVEYCLSVDWFQNWYQTTEVAPFTITSDKYFEIGLYHVQITTDPVSLPDVRVGDAYNQSISFAGGISPYTLEDWDSTLPAGLSFDESTLTVSGTPTAAGSGEIYLVVKDNAYNYQDFSLQFNIDAALTLTGISPATAVAGSSDVILEITGTGFTDGTMVRWNGEDLTTTRNSDTSLSAIILAGSMETPQTALVSVFSGEKTSNVLPFFVTENEAAVIEQSANNGTDPSASIGAVAASASGDGLLVVAEYDANPGGAAAFTASGSYFDVYTAPDNTFSQVVITACSLTAEDQLYWWDGTQWLVASPQSYAEGGCITLIVTESSSPALSQLQGTYFVAGVDPNTAPAADPGGPYLAAVNTAIVLDGGLSSDPEGDPLAFAWTVAEGTLDDNALASPAYTAGANAGIYEVCLSVNDGLLGSEPACTIVVVFDPSVGFVTGGGWINSPAGAYAPDPTLSGKATFGFVSRYKKGDPVPTGNTEFTFQIGGFSFQSTIYDWLVVSKNQATAQFKGSGTINGALAPNGSEYKFMLWAGDGTDPDGMDTFRIRIWWEGADGTEIVVYDNGFNQVIGGGSIVVHTDK